MANSSLLIGKNATSPQPDRDLTEPELITKATEEVNGFFSYFNTNIQNGRDDTYFLNVNQWDQEIYTLRTQAGKACFQVNHIKPVVESLIGKVRKWTPEFKLHTIVDQNNPNIKIDQNDIDMRDGLLRQRFSDNNSTVVFQVAAENALTRGYGAIIVFTDYENDYSFHQTMFMKAPPDPSWCFWDPNAKEPHKGDGNFCGWMESYTLEDFNDTFHRDVREGEYQAPRSFPSEDAQRQYETLWRNKTWIRVCHMFKKEGTPITLAKLSDGRSMELSKAKEAIEEFKAQKRKIVRLEKETMGHMGQFTGRQISGASYMPNFPDLTIVDTRPSVEYKIKYYQMTYDEILKESEWPSKIMPVIYMDGHSYYIDGQQYTCSFFRAAKDSQRFVNYIMSESAENILNAHKVQFMGTPSNFAGQEEEWRDPTKAQGALMYNLNEIGQAPIPVNAPQVSPSYIPLKMQAASDIQNCLGYYADNQGQQTNAESGSAVRARQAGGDLASFLFYDNLTRAVEQTAKCFLSLIPSLYDETREISIKNKNGDQTNVKINIQNGDQFVNDLTKGNFGLEVKAGNSFEMQKVENMDQMLQLVQILAPSNPQIAILFADIIASNTDLEFTTQLVDRIRAFMLGMNPTQILQKEMNLKVPPPPPAPPDPMVQLQQQQLQIEQGHLQVDQAKIQEMKDKNQTQLQIEHIKAATTIEQERMKQTTELHKAHIAAVSSRSRGLAA